MMISDMEKLTRALEQSRDALMNELLTNKTLNDARVLKIRERVTALKTELAVLVADASIALAKIESDE